MPVSEKKNKSLLRIISLWFVVLAWMAFIFFVSSAPGSAIPFIFAHQDIPFHLITYALLAYFFIRALRNSSRGLLHLHLILITVIFCVIYGASDEFHQLFVPGRSASGFDLLIDGMGSVFGSLAYR